MLLLKEKYKMVTLTSEGRRNERALLMLSVPANVEVHFNSRSFITASDTFKGVRLIQSRKKEELDIDMNVSAKDDDAVDIHFTFVGTGNENARARVGEFIVFDGDDLIVRTWDSVNERLFDCDDDEDADLEQRERLRLGVVRGDFENEQAKYERGGESDRLWRKLISFVDLRALARVGLRPGMMFVPGESAEFYDEYGLRRRLMKRADDDDDDDDALNERKKGEENVMIMKKDKTAKFNVKATSRSPDDVDTSVLTRIHIDPEYRFMRCLNMFDGEKRALLAEHQLAYVLFFFFGCAKALEQWKELTVIIANAMTELIKKEIEEHNNSDLKMKDEDKEEIEEEKEKEAVNVVVEDSATSWASFFVGFLDSIEAQFNDDATNEGSFDDVAATLTAEIHASTTNEKQISDVVRENLTKTLRSVNSFAFAKDIESSTTCRCLTRLEETCKRVLKLEIFKTNSNKKLDVAYEEDEDEDEKPIVVELTEGHWTRLDANEDVVEVFIEQKTLAEQNDAVKPNAYTRMSWMLNN